MKKAFTKADLVSGDLIETREGRVGIVLVGRGVVTAPTSNTTFYTWGMLENWKNDLSHRDHQRCDIVRVYSFKWNHSFNFEIGDRELVWERKPEKMVTIKGKEYSESTVLKALQSYCKE